MSGVPSTAEFPATADWYAWLTEAQVYWYYKFATHVPWVLLGAPTALTTADSGATYTFASSITPLYVEVYDSSSNGRLLRPGAYWDASADYVWEGDSIRIPRGKTRTWSGGPVARYITAPTTIDGSTAPTLAPDHTRILLVYRAVAHWAQRGGMRDPTPFLQAEMQAWEAILVGLKSQNPWHGAAAYANPQVLTGLEYVDTGSGYSAL